MATAVEESVPYQIPQFLQHGPTISDPEEATRILSNLDQAFKIIDRNEQGLRNYFNTVYSAPENQAGPPAGEEFHPNAASDDDSDDGEISEEELQERERILAAGRSRALDIGAIPLRELPDDVAKVVQECCWTFRRAWSEGHNSHFDKAWQKANTMIERLNSAAGRNAATYQIPHRTVLSLIPIIRAVAARWAAAKAQNQDSREHSKNAAALTMNLLGIFSEHGLRWKAVTPSEVKDVIFEICQEGAPQLGEAVMASLHKYLHQDTLSPSRVQTHVATKAEKPLEEMFKCAESGNIEGVKRQLVKVSKVNQEMQTANKAMSFKENDHVLPLSTIEAGFSGQALMRITPETILQYKEQFAFLLDCIGYGALALSLTSAERLKEIVPPEELKSNIQNLLTEYEHPIDDSADKNAHRENSDETGDGRVSPRPNPQTSSALDGLRKSTVPGPVIRDGITALGKITTVEAVGSSGSRCILNVGTETIPVFISVPGSEFGRGMREALLQLCPPQETPSPKHVKANAIKELKGVFQVGQGSSTRQPITKFLVEWKTEVVGPGVANESWVSRSDLNAICGKKFMEKEGGRLIQDWMHNLAFLKRMREEGKHPETGTPLTEQDRLNTPWLCPKRPLVPGVSTSEVQSDRMDLDENTAHIVTASSRFGSS